MFDDLTRGDFVAAEARLSAGVEWDTNARGSDGSTVHGREAAIRVIQEWLGAWEDASFEVLRVRSAGDDVAAHARQHARGKGSGLTGDVDAFATYEFLDGKVAVYREYATWSDCLRAVGLEE
jgi:ketosteroid isomerase-like protein